MTQSPKAPGLAAPLLILGLCLAASALPAAPQRSRQLEKPTLHEVPVSHGAPNKQPLLLAEIGLQRFGRKCEEPVAHPPASAAPVAVEVAAADPSAVSLPVVVWQTIAERTAPKASLHSSQALSPGATPLGGRKAQHALNGVFFQVESSVEAEAEAGRRTGDEANAFATTASEPAVDGFAFSDLKEAVHRIETVAADRDTNVTSVTDAAEGLQGVARLSVGLPLVPPASDGPPLWATDAVLLEATLAVAAAAAAQQDIAAATAAAVDALGPDAPASAPLAQPASEGPPVWAADAALLEARLTDAAYGNNTLQRAPDSFQLEQAVEPGTVAAPPRWKGEPREVPDAPRSGAHSHAASAGELALDVLTALGAAPPGPANLTGTAVVAAAEAALTAALLASPSGPKGHHESGLALEAGKALAGAARGAAHVEGAAHEGGEDAAASTHHGPGGQRMRLAAAVAAAQSAANASAAAAALPQAAHSSNSSVRAEEIAVNTPAASIPAEGSNATEDFPRLKQPESAAASAGAAPQRPTAASDAAGPQTGEPLVAPKTPQEPAGPAAKFGGLRLVAEGVLAAALFAGGGWLAAGLSASWRRTGCGGCGRASPVTWDLRRRVESLPRCGAEEVECRLPSGGGYDTAFSKPLSSGQPLRLEIRVEGPAASAAPLTAPLSGKACVVYSASVSRELHSGGRPAPVAFASGALDFVVSLKEAPKMSVKVRGQDVWLFDVCAGSTLTKKVLGNAPDRWQDFVATHRTTQAAGDWQAAAAVARSESAVLEFQECALLVGATATVVGELHRGADGAFTLRAWQGCPRGSAAPLKEPWKTSWEHGASEITPHDTDPGELVGRVLASDDPQLLQGVGRGLRAAARQLLRRAGLLHG